MSGLLNAARQAAAGLALALALCHAPASLAQSRGQPPTQPPTQPPQALSSLTINIEFKGGTVVEYVAALKQACKPTPANVILSDAAATDRLAPISLANVSLAAAIQAIPAASLSGVNSWQIIRLSDRLVGDDSPGTQDQSAPVYQVYKEPPRTRTQPGRAVMEVFSLRKVIESAADPAAADARLAAVLTAAETALHMNASPSVQPEMKFHKDSGLLIVRGEPEDVSTLREVIERAGDDAGRTAEKLARLDAARRIGEINVQRAMVNLDALQARLQVAQADLKEVEALAAQGQAPASALRQARAEVAERTADLRRCELEVQAAKAEAEIQGSLPDSPARRPAPDARPRSGDDKLRDENQALLDQVQALTKRVHDLEAALAAGRANNPPSERK